MKFQKYQHIERYGTVETEGIEIGNCFIFPKIDGTNASCWVDDGVLKAGSRNRELSIDNDNAGFYKHIFGAKNLLDYFNKFPNRRLYGEWLVSHSLKTYRNDAWRKFYVFDVVEGDGEDRKYISYKEYQEDLAEFGIEFIPPICEIKNGSVDSFHKQLEKNTFLIKDGEGFGEGICIKNYDYTNKFGRQTWAKIVTNEFKEKHVKEMGHPVVSAKALIEDDIVSKYVTETLVEKEYAKIVSEEEGWRSKFIPRLLHTVFYCLVKEESWNFVKEFKNPTIDFQLLQKLTIQVVKKCKPELF